MTHRRASLIALTGMLVSLACGGGGGQGSPSTPPPTASFGISSPTIEVGGSATFTDTSSPSPNTWVWDFGDGSKSREQNPTHTYTRTGTYTASLTAANASGSSSTSKTLKVQIWLRGFGAGTLGGTGGTTVHVTNLNDSGPGSLRAALSGSNRIVVFDVGGDITLSDYIRLNRSPNFITVDGSTAPAPGITLHGHPILIENGAHDIILSNFRHRCGWSNADGTRNDAAAGVTISTGCYNILIDHLSVSGSEDESLDVWDANQNITIQNCLLGPGGWIDPLDQTRTLQHDFPLLVGHFSQRISLFGNLFVGTNYRNPAVGYDDAGGAVAPAITGDVVNNVVWGYTAYGTTIYWGAKGNVVGNYYYSSRYPSGTNRAVNTDGSTGSLAYATGNFSLDGSTVTGNASSPFAVEAYAQITPMGAQEALAHTKAHAGCRVGGLDTFDLGLLASME